MREVRALGRDDRADEPVERHVEGDLVADPSMEADGPLHAREPLVAAQAVGPLQGPEVDVLGPLEERIDQPRPLVGATILEERDDLFGRGDQADHVEVDAAAELASSLRAPTGGCAAASAWRRRARR